MDDGGLISVLSLAFSLVAVGVSAVLAVRQSRLMRHNNLLPVITEMFREFRDPAFKDHLSYLQHRLWTDCPPENIGTSGLTPTAREHVLAVSGFFNSVGLLVAHGVVDEKIPCGFMGGSVLRAWARLSPYVVNERRQRNDPNYLMMFEDLARRSLDLPPSRLRALLKPRRMPDEWHFEGWTDQPPEVVAARFAPVPPQARFAPAPPQARPVAGDPPRTAGPATGTGPGGPPSAPPPGP